MSDLVIIVPMLTRAHRVDPLIESIRETTDCEHTILFVATEGDLDVIAAVETHGDVRLEVIPPNQVGDYAIKINHGYHMSDEPFLFLGADDLKFHVGWWAKARSHFADPTIGVVGTQDQCNERVRRGIHATHSVVSRVYVDRFGTIDEPGKVLHQGYVHEFVDDEFVATAKKRGAFKFEPGSIVEHLHPMVGKAPSDALYAAQDDRMKIDRVTFQARTPLWTDVLTVEPIVVRALRVVRPCSTVGISIVKDDADIIESTVRHLASQVSALIVADMSTDGTSDILDRLTRDINLTVIDSEQSLTELAGIARREHGADWIVPFDADEWWYSPFGTIGDILARLDAWPVIPAVVYDHVATGQDDPTVTDPVARLGWRRQPPEALKVACRWRDDLIIEMGHHAAGDHGDAAIHESPLVVRRFAYRSVEQLVRKITDGTAPQWAVLDENAEVLFKTWCWQQDPRAGIEVGGKIQAPLIFDPVS